MNIRVEYDHASNVATIRHEGIDIQTEADVQAWRKMVLGELAKAIPKGQKASVRKASARKADRLGYKGRVVEMVVSKPLCSPVRDVLLTMVPAKSPGDAYYPVGWLDYQIVEQGITQIAARDLARQWKIERETRENLQ